MQNENSCKALEIMGHIIKYIDVDIQELVTDIILTFSDRSNDNYWIYLLDFFKAIWKICDEITRNRIMSCIDTIELIYNDNLKNQVRYTKSIFSSIPRLKEESSVLLLIPEFLTSSSFLQQPLDYMEVVYYLEKAGIMTDVLDNRVHNYSLDQVISIIRKYKVVVISSCPVDMVQKYYLDYRYAIFCSYMNYFKKCNDIPKLLVHGVHGIVKPEWLLNDIGNVEIINDSTIETFLIKVMNALNISRQISIDLEGAHYSFECIDMQWYYGRRFKDGITYQLHNYSIMQLSKGCPFSCLFCYRHYGNQTKHLSVNNSISIMKELAKYGITNVFFIDQTFTYNRGFVIDFCKRIIENNINIFWQCETRADCLDEEILQLMKQAGCQAIWIGFESFDTTVLRINNKDVVLDKQLEIIHLIRKNGIECCGFIMLGMPGDTKASLITTVEYVINNKIPLSKSINRCTMRPGTKLYDIVSHKFDINGFFDLESYSGQILNHVKECDLQLAEYMLNAYVQNE